MPKSKVYVHNEYDLKFRRILAENFKRKKLTNPRYSLRAFSRLVEIDQSLLSKILNGKKAVAPGTMIRVLRRLKVSEDVLDDFSDYRRNPAAYGEVPEEKFRLIADWKYFAILELFNMESFVCTLGRIAEKLKISEEEAAKLLRQLEAAGFIKGDGRIFEARVGKNSTALLGQTSDARVRFQKSVLRESLDSLDRIPHQYRDHGTTIFTINKSDVEEFRQILKETRRKLVDLLMNSKDHDEVFVLSVSLFPVTFSDGEVEA